ncbi:hypothetical protein [Nocardia brasiliensis]|uniref:SCO6045-like C-terminal domain-containing protein n=1 Tax=Nocardia brasiliensis (strain ATCC 700358 / HUJEG-1) TaxID=1133849 RepID=K0F8V9_NOCB7|nr:hypothetical protein [Nocardia brasiliensis]AFU06157.1 hypothetical protein O3I_041060 [Nocardia brasiliensis ATCC 700358]OCF88652.1 hypothetical protein AW168_20245 [Nocardia brasiliensis]
MSAELAAQQAALVRALVAGAPVPAGFDCADVAAAAHALLRKRADEVARRFPMLAQACGPDFRERFLAWADGRSKTSTAADATAFAASQGLPAPVGTTTKRWPRR